MYLKSVDGKILFDGRFANVKAGLEMAVEDRVDLTAINLRGANLSGAQLDDAVMPKACLWGANLNGANMSSGNFEDADFRTANFLDTCLAQANLQGVNFEGAYFSRTIFAHANLKHTQFSCPSLFSVDLSTVASLEGAIYSHLGEVDCDLSHAPIIIHGLPKRMIFMDDCMLVGTEHRKISIREHVLEAILSQNEIQKIMVNQ